MSMKNSNDTIGNRTRDLPACSAVPQPAAPHLDVEPEALKQTFQRHINNNNNNIY